MLLYDSLAGHDLGRGEGTEQSGQAVTFAQASTVMLDPLALTVFDASHSETEERWFTLGITSDGRLLAVSHTYCIIDTTHTQIRMISARDATRRELHYYENEPR